MALLIEVIKVQGECPIYQVGDQITLEGAEINGKICIHALSALTSLMVPIRQGIPPNCFGIGSDKEGFLQCPDPGPPLTDGGTVTFRLQYIEEPGPSEEERSSI